MDDNKSLSKMFSQMIPDGFENQLGLNKDQPGEQDNALLANSLKAVAGASGGSFADAVNDFLGGKGELHQTTRSAVASGSSSAVRQIVSLLTGTFNLSPAIANMIAPLLVKLLPSINQAAGKEPETKAKPTRKSQPGLSATAKAEAGGSKKTTTKKTTTRATSTITSKTVKKKPPTSSSKKTTTTAPKPKKPKRTSTT